MLFDDLQNVSLFKAKETFTNLIDLNSVEAEKLSRYVIEPRNSNKIEKKKYSLKIDQVISNIEDLAKPYKIIAESDIDRFIKELASEPNADRLKKLRNFLKRMELVQSITVDKMRNNLEQLLTPHWESSNEIESM